jgi:hypothetical protein
MVIQSHQSEAIHAEEAPVTNRAMGCEQLVKLSRVAGEAGDNLPGDERSRRDTNEELE